jgi:hypothetical protein
MCCCEIGPVAVIVMACFIIAQGVFAIMCAYIPLFYFALLPGLAWLVGVLSVLTGVCGIVSASWGFASQTSRPQRAVAVIHLILALAVLVSLIAVWGYTAYKLANLTCRENECGLYWAGYVVSGILFLALTLIYVTAIAVRWMLRTLRGNYERM